MIYILMLMLATTTISDELYAKDINSDTFYTHAVNSIKQNEKEIKKLTELMQENGLPEEFSLIPLIESEYDPRAISISDAAGMWQLMKETGNDLGLHVGDDYDERLDKNISTSAAINYLKKIYKKFNKDINLTLAAYNSGPGYITRQILSQGTSDFSKLNLYSETQRYVVKFNIVKEAYRRVND